LAIGRWIRVKTFQRVQPSRMAASSMEIGTVSMNPFIT